MNYPPLKFKMSGGPLDGEDWMPRSNPNTVMRDGVMTFNLTRRNEKKEAYTIQAKYKIEFDQDKKTYSATFMEPNG